MPPRWNMDNDIYRTVVPADIKDLIPGFLASRRKDIEVLRAALEAQDFAKLRETGRTLRGVGTPFGFPHITALGRYVEGACELEDAKGVQATIDELEKYLDRVNVVYE